MSIVEVAEEEAAARSVHVNAVYLKLGALSGVVKEALLSSWELAAAGTALEGSRLEIEEVPVVVFCPQCRERRTPASLQWFSCPECNAPVSEILEGKELQVTALEVVE